MPRKEGGSPEGRNWPLSGTTVCQGRVGHRGWTGRRSCVLREGRGPHPVLSPLGSASPVCSMSGYHLRRWVTGKGDGLRGTSLQKMSSTGKL